MNTFELLEELSKKSKEELQYCLTELMINGKIDFIDINRAYVMFLKNEREDLSEKFAESNYAMLGLLMHFKKENKSNSDHIHRALHNLNESKLFNMNGLNEKFGYDEKNDRELSWYWKNKNKM